MKSVRERLLSAVAGLLSRKPRDVELLPGKKPYPNPASGVLFDRYAPAHMKTVNRCPRHGCPGTLYASITGHTRGPWHGYVGGTRASYRCNVCYIRFEVLNPNSFIKDISQCFPKPAPALEEE